MKTDRELDEILAEMGREHRSMDAPARLESVLCAAAGRKRRVIGMPGARLAWTLAAVAILVAAIATAGSIWQAHRSREAQMQQAVAVPLIQHGPEPAPVSTNVVGRQGASKSVRARRVGRGNELLGPLLRPVAGNSLDEFVPLPVSEGLPTGGEMSVVRVRLRGSDLQQYGLETPADAVAQTMMAEFVVGEDGLPRAIRILR